MFSHPSKLSRATKFWVGCLALASTALFCVPERARAAPIALGPAASRYYARTMFRYYKWVTEENEEFIDVEDSPFTALPFHASNSFGDSGFGGSATLTSNLDLTASAEEDRLSMIWNRSGSATGHQSSSLYITDAFAESFTDVSFVLTEAGRYSWSNSDFTTNLSGNASAILYRVADSTVVFQRHKRGGSAPIDISAGSFAGLLPAGAYRLLESTSTSGDAGSFAVQSEFLVATGFLWDNPAGGTFASPSNWFNNLVPGATNRAVFDIDDEYSVAFTADVSSDKLKIQNGLVDFDLNGRTYTLLGAVDGKSVVIGDADGVGITELVLHGGVGSALKALGDVNIGARAESSGIHVRDDAILSVDGSMQVLASDAFGFVSVDHGRVDVAGATQLALEPTGPDRRGRINLENQSVFITDRLEVGVRGRGEVHIASGSSLSSREVVLGVDSGSTGKLTITGPDSQLLALLGPGKITVGDSGSGEMNVADGGYAFVKELEVGASANSIDVVTVTGVGSRLVATHVGLGVAPALGNGRLVVDGGGTVTSDTMSLGDASSNQGSLKVSGAGSAVTVTQILKVAPLLADVKVEVIDGAALTVGHALIGTQFLSPLSDASVVIRDATWQINGNLTVAGGVGGLAQTSVKAAGSSTVTVAGDMRVGSVLVIASGGGHVEVSDSASLIVQGEFSVRGSILGTSVTTVAGGTINSVHDVYLGSQLELLFGEYGDLSLAHGTAISAPAVHVQYGGKLLGSGIVHGNVLRQGGFVAPGYSPGVLTIDGDYTEIGEGTLLMEVGGTALGDEYDQLNVTGNATFAGTLVVRFINGFAPHAGDEFAFLHVGGTQTGAFSQIEIENLAPGFQYDLTAGVDGLSLRALNDGEFVPEPASAVMLLTGVVVMFFFRRTDVS